MEGHVIIILAAGSSSRLGRPKQLLPFGDVLLIQRTVRSASEARPGKVVVVTGAYAEGVEQVLSATDVIVVHNPAWEEGLSSSIRAGVNALTNATAPAGIILSVCDQPFITADLFLQMAHVQAETGKGIVACGYADTIGVPVLFHSRYFYALANLPAGEGAKGLIRRHRDDVAVLPFGDGVKDIDTEEDYRRFLP